MPDQELPEAAEQSSTDRGHEATADSATFGSPELQAHQGPGRDHEAGGDGAEVLQADVPDADGSLTVADDGDDDGDESMAPLDLAPVAAYLNSSTASSAHSRWADAETTLRAIFSDSTWGIGGEPNPYGADAYANILQRESRKDFKDWIANEGVTLERFTQALGEIQYVSIQIFLKRLFPRARSNRGWRIRIVGFPALELIAIGLGSHYQGTQNQNAMGVASRHLHQAALEFLPPDLRVVLAEFPPATPEDWEERGLMGSPITSLGDLDISSFDAGAGAKLRMVRNTTVKKDLSTFFAIKGLTASEFLASGEAELRKLQRLAISLGTEGRTGE